MKILKYIMLALCALLVRTGAEACSRVVYTGTKGIVMVGRTLDWRTPIPTNIYVYPRGVEKTSMNSQPSLSWKSKYATVLAVGYDGGATEGMNEKGLIMNGLFCKTAVYTQPVPGDDSTPVVSLAMIVSFFLDNFATVDEADTWLQSNKFAIFGQTFDGGTVSALHWALTDASGKTLLMEYVDGDLITYKSDDLKVLTNDPEHPQMMAINNYWRQIGGKNMLPGTVRSADRFVRADFFIRHVPADYDSTEAFGALSSIMGTVSVPYGYELEGEPNVSSTQWTSIADASGRYYFRRAVATGYFWVDLGRLVLKEGAPILKFDTARHPQATGCVNSLLEQSQGFTPMW